MQKRKKKEIFLVSLFVSVFTLGNFSKPLRRWSREQHQTKDLMSKTTAVHVHHLTNCEARE